MFPNDIYEVKFSSTIIFINDTTLNDTTLNDTTIEKQQKNSNNKYLQREKGNIIL